MLGHPRRHLRIVPETSLFCSDCNRRIKFIDELKTGKFIYSSTKVMFYGIFFILKYWLRLDEVSVSQVEEIKNFFKKKTATFFDAKFTHHIILTM